MCKGLGQSLLRRRKKDKNKDFWLQVNKQMSVSREGPSPLGESFLTYPLLSTHPHLNPLQIHLTKPESLSSLSLLALHWYHPGSTTVFTQTGKASTSLISLTSSVLRQYSQKPNDPPFEKKGNEFMPFPTLNSQWCPITWKQDQNLHHRFLEPLVCSGPIWPGFSLLFCIFYCLLPPAVLVTAPASKTIHPGPLQDCFFWEQSPTACMTPPSVYSGLSSNIRLAFSLPSYPQK